jgi:hypothetical protein
MYSFATCTLCAAGTYKSDLGSACSSCALGKTSLPGSTAESNCRDIIKCNTGYTGPDDGICTTCASGSYKPTVGSQSCTLCDANTYGTVVAVISVMSCVACPGNATSVAGSSQSTSCQYNRGYSGPNGSQCNACQAGFYKNTIGSAFCSACPTNSFSDNVSTALTSCKCNRGYSGPDGGQCNACNAGFYKNTIGSGLCSACPANSVSNLASDVLTDCKCNKGYSGADGSNCIRCSANLYKDTIGSENCTSCPVATVSNIASIALTNCTCTVGYSGPDGSVCSEQPNAPPRSADQPGRNCGFDGSPENVVFGLAPVLGCQWHPTNSGLWGAFGTLETPQTAVYVGTPKTTVCGGCQSFGTPTNRGL